MPRAKSPHMDNEEPIELAHYPPAHPPAPGEVPAIEREDFPAPPYPYAVEGNAKVGDCLTTFHALAELKRRLSLSSVENDDEEEEDIHEANRKHEEKVKKNVEALGQLDKDSSIAHVIKQNLEESNKKTRLPLHWDPRNASRTPSAKKMPHLRFRYDTPINACRHLKAMGIYVTIGLPWIRMFSSFSPFEPPAAVALLGPGRSTSADLRKHGHTSQLPHSAEPKRDIACSHASGRLLLPGRSLRQHAKLTLLRS